MAMAWRGIPKTIWKDPPTPVLNYKPGKERQPGSVTCDLESEVSGPGQWVQGGKVADKIQVQKAKWALHKCLHDSVFCSLPFPARVCFPSSFHLGSNEERKPQERGALPCTLRPPHSSRPAPPRSLLFLSFLAANQSTPENSVEQHALGLVKAWHLPIVTYYDDLFAKGLFQ